jgi:hypothetical protein
LEISEQNREYWARMDPIDKEILSARRAVNAKALWARLPPEEQERRIAKLLGDPERRIANSRAFACGPEHIERLRRQGFAGAMKARLADPDFRARVAAGARESRRANPNLWKKLHALTGERMRTLWADPAYRERVIANLRRGWERKARAQGKPTVRERKAAAAEASRERTRRRAEKPSPPGIYIFVWYHNGVPKYVGRGRGDTWSRQRYDRRYRTKYTYFEQYGKEMTCLFPFQNLTEAEALTHKTELIAKYGLECDGTGSLLNQQAKPSEANRLGRAAKLKQTLAAPEQRERLAKQGRTTAAWMRTPEGRERKREIGRTLAANLAWRAKMKAIFNQPEHIERLRRQGQTTGRYLAALSPEERERRIAKMRDAQFAKRIARLKLRLAAAVPQAPVPDQR